MIFGLKCLGWSGLLSSSYCEMHHELVGWVDWGTGSKVLTVNCRIGVVGTWDSFPFFFSCLTVFIIQRWNRTTTNNHRLWSLELCTANSLGSWFSQLTQDRSYGRLHLLPKGVLVKRRAGPGLMPSLWTWWDWSRCISFHVGCVSLDFLWRWCSLSAWNDKNSETQDFWPCKQNVAVNLQSENSLRDRTEPERLAEPLVTLLSAGGAFVFVFWPC